MRLGQCNWMTMFDQQTSVGLMAHRRKHTGCFQSGRCGLRCSRSRSVPTATLVPLASAGHRVRCLDSQGLALLPNRRCRTETPRCLMNYWMTNCLSYLNCLNCLNFLMNCWNQNCLNYWGPSWNCWSSNWSYCSNYLNCWSSNWNYCLSYRNSIALFVGTLVGSGATE